MLMIITLLLTCSFSSTVTRGFEALDGLRVWGD